MSNDLEHILNLYQKPSIGLDINQKYFIFSKKHMTCIDHIMVPRLNWDDRRIEYQIALQKYNNQQNHKSESMPNLNNIGLQYSPETQAVLPKKLIVCGRYRNLDVLEQKSRLGAD